ncbi:MAG TPA: VWA domain-containing protein, partial [Pyrinomonadaceae bacterium]|nr:VWA domain-containing protein [Pyrinomonadaceae bacterium]
MKAARFFLLLIYISILIVNISAQDEDEVIRVETQIIDVPVVVTDKDGKPLLNLKKNNFVIYEDGKPQEISDFSATAAPFEVALLLDTSGSTRQDLLLIKRAADNFIASLRPGDRVAIIAYKTERTTTEAYAVSEVLSGLTDDRTSLKAALEKAQNSNSTPFYDSLLQVVEKVFAEKPAAEFRGRRALVALTDGVDSVSVGDFEEVREKFNESGVVSFFIQVNTRDYFEENLLGECYSEITRFSPAQINRYYRTFPKQSNMEKTTDFCKIGDFERLDISKKLYELADKEMNELAKNS